MKRRVYTEVMYDYSTREEAEKDKEQMKAKGWFVKDEYRQEYQEGFDWTVEYHR